MALNQQVTIQQLSGTFGDDGTPGSDWTDVCTVWADIRHVSGIEQVKADTIMSRVRASVRIRQRQGINAAMRVVHGATIYSIVAVLPDLQGRMYTDLACEVVA